MPWKELGLNFYIMEAAEREEEEMLREIDFRCGRAEDFGIGYVVNLLRLLARNG